MAKVFVNSFTNGGQQLELDVSNVNEVLDYLGVNPASVVTRVYDARGDERVNYRRSNALHENDEIEVQRISTKNG